MLAFRPDNPQLQLITPAEPAGARAQLLVVVDTEEEFDWSAPFSRAARSVTAIRSLPVVQRLCDRYELKPSYVVDYPVASQADGIGPIREMLVDGRCAVGAHLHPWVNPPYDEALLARNSFACNLDPPVEAAKLRVLHAEVSSAFGSAPLIYKAGRYGIGVSTLDILRELGFQIDTSVNPHMNFTSMHGPDFRGFPESPSVIAGWLAEIPCTTGFAGAAWRSGERLHDITTASVLRRLRAPGVLARLGILNRINLSPETSTLAEMIRLTRALLKRGIRTFTLSFHSPSVEAGHTPYVRTAADLRRFLDRVQAYFDFFFGDLGGRSATPLDVRTSLVAALEDTQ